MNEWDESKCQCSGRAHLRLKTVNVRPVSMAVCFSLTTLSYRSTRRGMQKVEFSKAVA